MRDVIRWGIVSTGNIAHSFAQDMQFVPDGEVVAVASRNGEKAKDFAQQYDIPRAHETYQDLFDDPNVDAVYIATPHNLHYQNSLDAMAAGKAVLCEKPLTINPAENRSLLAKAREDKIYLMEAMWTYFLPALHTARRWIDEGRIGTVRHIKADFGFKMNYDPDGRLYNPALAGGALLDIGIYPIALAWFFMERDPLSMKVAARKAPTGVDDDVVMIFDYPEIVATLSCTFRCVLPNAAHIVGDEGIITLPEFWHGPSCHLYKDLKEVDTFVDDRESRGYHYEIAAVNADLKAGKLESDTMPHATSQKLQDHMAAVMRLF